jgi:hypothetical protein
MVILPLYHLPEIQVHNFSQIGGDDEPVIYRQEQRIILLFNSM